MIDLYSWPTPNGHKIHIMLHECQLPHRVHPIDIGAGDQFQTEFLRISPNNKIPAIIDHAAPPQADGSPFALFESGAILLYLAAKTGRFLPTDDQAKFQVLQWLMFQMGGVGPMLGQNHHFRRYAPTPIPYAIERYTNEAKRLYGVMDKQLQQRAWIAGDDYTIADMAIFPWLRTAELQGINWTDYPNLKQWFERINARPAVQAALTVLADARRPLTDDKARDNLFGATQYAHNLPPRA